MKRLIYLFYFLSVSDAFGDTRVLDFLYEIRSDNSAATEQFEEINKNARNLELNKALSELESITNKPSEVSTLSGLNRLKALCNVAIMKVASGDYTDGLVGLDNSIAALSDLVKPFDPVMVRALVVRGIAALSVEDYNESRKALRRAQHILHREEGVFTLNQLPLVDYLALTNLRAGEPFSADREQLFSVTIVKKEFGDRSESIIPRLIRVGNYFAQRAMGIPISTDTDSLNQRAWMLKTSRQMHLDTIEIFEELYGTDSPKLIAPLRRLAKAKLIASMGRKSAESDLRRALELSSKNEEVDKAEVYAVNVDLGDFYAVTKNEKSAAQYLLSWKLMQEEDAGKQLAKSYFDSPVRLHPPKISHFSLDRLPDSAEPGSELFVDLEFGINEAGRVFNAKITDKNIPNDQARAVRQREKNTIYRPRIEEGVFVPVDANQLRQLFKVKQLNKQEEKVVPDPSPESEEKKTANS